MEHVVTDDEGGHGPDAEGVCRTCRHFQPHGGGRGRCGLTGEPLGERDAGKLCREHEPSVG